MRLYLFSEAISLWLQDIYTILFGAGVKSFPIFMAPMLIQYIHIMFFRNFMN